MKLLALMGLLIGNQLFAAQCKLKVEVKGVKPDGKELCVYLFDKKNEDEFPTEYGKAAQKECLKTASEIHSVEFVIGENGEYAVSVHHDSDGDGELKTNWIGMPKEGIGVSKDVKGFMGPPDFEDASLKLAAGCEPIVINMKYL